MEKEKIVLTLLITIIIVLFLIKDTAVATLYEENDVYITTQEQLQRVQDMNISLQNQILQKESYTTIYQEETSKGFIQNGEVVLNP